MDKAHRVAYALAVGPIPAGMMVCHRCDNRRCVRAEPGPAGHLFLGTAKDNLVDASKKGRLAYSLERRKARRGEGNPNARLTWEAARSIRAARVAGSTYRQLQQRFSVGTGTIAAVLSGLTWKEDVETQHSHQRRRT